MFWPLQSHSEFSGVLEDSQVPFSGVWVATSHFPQSGVATKIMLCKKWYKLPCRRTHNAEHPRHHNLLGAPKGFKCIITFWMTNVIIFVTWKHDDFETTLWRLIKNLKCEKFGKFTNTYLQNKFWRLQGGTSNMSSSSWRSKSFVAFGWNWAKSWISWRWSLTVGFNTNSNNSLSPSRTRMCLFTTWQALMEVLRISAWIKNHRFEHKQHKKINPRRCWKCNWIIHVLTMRSTTKSPKTQHAHIKVDRKM